MVLRTAELPKQPPQRVVAIYQVNKGKGWCVIANGMGIKPGSMELHALKRGEVPVGGGGRQGGNNPHGEGNGGRNPGNGYGKGPKKQGTRALGWTQRRVIRTSVRYFCLWKCTPL